jgi:hypothetical protein
MPMQVRIHLRQLYWPNTDATTIGVIEDAKFKRREALADLAAAVEK